MDLEGITRRLLDSGRDPFNELPKLISIYRGNVQGRDPFIEALVEEVRNSRSSNQFSFSPVGLRAGEAGLGSRGVGDYDVHSALLEASGSDPRSFDDAGLAEDVLVSVDGIHSRLSFFPYLAGFHATRAALRDVMVKGGRPLGVLVDIHLSDDSDVSMLFDFEAGVTTVTDFLKIRILAGSTLRIGGDVVIGERISGGVGAIAKAPPKPLGRANVKPGHYVVMTEGHGGGTVTATAIYHGRPDVVEATINLYDLLSCQLVRDRLLDYVDAMTDVTNGGIRGDALEVSRLTSTSLVIYPEIFRSLIDPHVLRLMDDVNVDPYGISIDSIMIFTKHPDLIIGELSSRGIKADVVGRVENFIGFPMYVEEDGKLRELSPNFRESPYTPVKKVIGNSSKYDRTARNMLISKALAASLEKKKRFSSLLNSSEVKGRKDPSNVG
ncbi:AIR synthase related protein [Sulfodiicoccus acidiphilus]|nr:AIR synthase related protein [Sulfodiicoccus acidiphilus]